MEQMVDRVETNFRISTNMIRHYDESSFERLDINEHFADRCETELTSYIIRINRAGLSEDAKFMLSEILNSIGDVERIGDYCMNIAYIARDMNHNRINFSQEGMRELDLMMRAAQEILSNLITSFRTRDRLLVIKTEPLSDVIEQMSDVMKDHHILRLQEGICNAHSGAAFFDLTNSFERISAHAGNVALHIIKRMEANRSFDEMHGNTQNISGDDYVRIIEDYENLYLLPVKSGFDMVV